MSVEHKPARETLSLNGPWMIVFDPDNVGEMQGWDKEASFISRPQGRAITVPGCWEETEQDYEGVAWYGRALEVPTAWDGKAVRLIFSAVNYVAEVWLNDQIVGFHEGGYTPFSFDVADLLKYGQRNFLIVRVIGPIIIRDAKIDGIGHDEMPHWRGALAGGIWQPVELVATSRVYVSDVFVEPHIASGTATINLKIENTNVLQRSISLELSVTTEQDEDHHIAQARLELDAAPGTTMRTVELSIENPVLWSPENPYLYVVTASVEEEGHVIDVAATRFGMREFTVQGDVFILNGKPLFIKAAFWEGFYPTTLANPKDPGIVRREIALAKEAGFNMLRPWRKPLQPFILDLADEMGILVISCPPIECMNYWPQLSPQLEYRLSNEVEQLVLRDRNHASVAYFEILNEVVRPALGRLKHKLALLARRHDPTRLIVDESGGWAGGAHYYLPYSTEPVRFNELHCYLRAPVDDKIYDFLLSVGTPTTSHSQASDMRSQIAAGKPTVVSEVGYGSLSDLPKDMARYRAEGNPKTPDYRSYQGMLESLEKVSKDHGLDKVFASTSDFCLATQQIQAAANKRQIEALRLNPQIRGYCLHAYTDGDWIYGASILDTWREPKKAYAALREVNRRVYLAIRSRPANVYAGKPVTIEVDLVNEDTGEAATLHLEVSSAAGQRVFTAQKAVVAKQGASHLLDAKVETKDLAGSYSAVARLEKGGAVLSENSYSFFVVPAEDLRTPDVAFDVVDPDQALMSFVQSHNLKAHAFIGEQPSGCPVVVGCENAADRQTFETFVYLLDYVHRGGVAVFLEPPLVRSPDLRLRWLYKPSLLQPQDNSLLSTGLFPLNIESRWGTGHWIPVSHIVPEHPAFAHLPARCLMGSEYQNVCPVETMIGLDGDTIAGSISIRMAHTEMAKLNYLGLNTIYWGSDLAVVNVGKGKMLLSTLRIIPYLGKDPVADVIFNNLVRYAACLAGPVAPHDRRMTEVVTRYLGAFDQWKADAEKPAS